VIMIFEMTRDYSIIVPLMISNLISFFISWQLHREPCSGQRARILPVDLSGANPNIIPGTQQQEVYRLERSASAMRQS
jgi:H+/Cl- antiporter ClcA